MAILTVEQFRALSPSVLEDAALQILLDAAEEAIVAYAGSPSSAVELFSGEGPYLTLTRPADSITSIAETSSTGTVTTLAADDYLIYPGGHTVQRLNTGTTRRRYWRGRVTVTYVPVLDTAERQRVQQALVQLDLNYAPGQTAEQIGSWMEQNQASADWNYQNERASILASLSAASRPAMLVVG